LCLINSLSSRFFRWISICSRSTLLVRQRELLKREACESSCHGVPAGVASVKGVHRGVKEAHLLEHLGVALVLRTQGMEGVCWGDSQRCLDAERDAARPSESRGPRKELRQATSPFAVSGCSEEDREPEASRRSLCAFS
jgi:hypothetical protein